MTTLFLLGRILLGGYFVYNGYNHLKNLEGSAGYAASKGVPMSKVAVGVTGAMLILGGASVVFGAYTVVGIWLLLAFLVPVTFQMHQFWKMTDPMQKMGEQINFTKNLALIGALLMLLSLATPWVKSVAF